jgi:WD40 repeat protein
VKEKDEPRRIVVLAPTGEILERLPRTRLGRARRPVNVVQRGRSLLWLVKAGTEPWLGLPEAEEWACTRDGKSTAWVRDDGKVEINHRGHKLPLLSPHWKPTVLALATSILLVGSERGCELYALPSLARIPLDGPASDARTLQLNPQGDRVLIGGRHGTISIITLATGRVGHLRRDHTGSPELGLASTADMAHIGSVRGLAWSQDGATVATVAQSSRYPESVALWDTQTLEIRALGLRRPHGYRDVDLWENRIALVSGEGDVILTTRAEFERRPDLTPNE